MSDSTEMYTVTEYLMRQKTFIYFKVQEYYGYQLLKSLSFTDTHRIIYP